MEHRGFLAVFRIDEVQFNHQLATVANAEAERVGSCIEFFQRGFCFVVPKESACPSFCGAKHVGVGKSAAEHNHVHVVERFASGCQIGHVHVFHIESCKVEGIGHFAIAIDSFFSDDGGLDACRLPPVGFQPVGIERAFEFFRETISDGLLFVVQETFFCACLSALLAVEQIGRFKPNVAQVVDKQQVVLVLVGEEQRPFVLRLADAQVADAVAVEHAGCFLHVLVVDLHDDGAVFGK